MARLVIALRVDSRPAMLRLLNRDTGNPISNSCDRGYMTLIGTVERVFSW